MPNILNFPNLRFPEFEGEWEVKKLGRVCKMQAGKFINASGIFDKQNENLFPCYGGNGLRGYAESFNHSGIYSLIGRQGALCGNVTLAKGKFYATEHAIVVKPEKNNDTIWMFYLLSSLNLNQYATGQAQPGLSVQNLEKIEIVLPESKAEQIKIGAFLSLIDERIETQNKIIEELKLLKSTIRNKIFEKIRESDFKKLEIRHLLEYEHPTKYIVENVDYLENPTLIPVLTANKAFVLGYTDERCGVYDKGDCIIFDDFTMDMKYVDFSFKVKSSAIKILTPKPKINLRYMFEYLTFLSLSSNEHKRHYISAVEDIIVSVPDVEKQNSIARLLHAFDRKIKAESSLCILLCKQKKYLLREMFI